jgi:hypothetical protein
MLGRSEACGEGRDCIIIIWGEGSIFMKFFVTRVCACGAP